MPEDVLVPGTRDVRATLSAPEADVCVVACPPHPRYGGSRSDGRLRAVSDALGERGIACLRFDYGAWDEGCGERRDCENGVDWARERYDRVGLFGYSFGAAVAIAVAGGGSAGADSLACVSVLAPPARVGSVDVVPLIERVDAPLQVLYGERDGTVDWAAVVDAARARDADVVTLDGGHFFGGLGDEIGRAVAAFADSRAASGDGDDEDGGPIEGCDGECRGHG